MFDNVTIIRSAIFELLFRGISQKADELLGLSRKKILIIEYKLALGQRNLQNYFQKEIQQLSK